MLPTTNKKGDRQRTPRSPFGLPQKRPRPEPRPPKVRTLTVATAARRAASLPARLASGLWMVLLEMLFPLAMLLDVLLEKRQR